MSKLASLSKKEPVVHSVLGCDISTNSLAFCFYDAGKPVRWGEINFKGDNVFERLSDGQRKVRALSEYFKADMIVFESAVYVQNKKTVILLAYAFGAIVAALMENGMSVEGISPIEWQRAIGNPTLTKAQKDQIRSDNPGKSASWYQNHGREIRKARTMKWVSDTFEINVDSDNVSDCIAIAHVGYNKFAKNH